MNRKNDQQSGEEIYCEVVSRGQTMRGFLHRPPDFSPARRYPAVLFLHGLTGTHIEPHRFFVLAARHLASRGIIAGRFDFIGNGNSDGDFIHVSPDSEIEDTLALLQWLQGQAGVDRTRLGLIGLSLGGMVAACAGARFGVRALCLWAATARMHERMKEQTTAKSTAKFMLRGWHDMGGNKAGRAFFESTARLKPLDEAKTFGGKVLILHGEEDSVVPVEEAHEYATAFASCKPQLKILAGADHTFNRVEWAQEVIETTGKWLGENL